MLEGKRASTLVKTRHLGRDKVDIPLQANELFDIRFIGVLRTLISVLQQALHPLVEQDPNAIDRIVELSIDRSQSTQYGRVGICTGGGSGHLPICLSYVVERTIDGSVGNVFASASAEQMLDITKAIDKGARVLYIYGNYGGDYMNFDMAAEMPDIQGIRFEQILVRDDVASAPKGNGQVDVAYQDCFARAKLPVPARMRWPLWAR